MYLNLLLVPWVQQSKRQSIIIGISYRVIVICQACSLIYQIPTPGTLSDAHGNFQCKDCVACSHYLKSKSFTHPQTGKIYKIKQLITCKTTHVIYIIMCSCPLLYVGKTKRALHTRIVEHMSAIRRQDQHFSGFSSFWVSKTLFFLFQILALRGFSCKVEVVTETESCYKERLLDF